MSQKQFNRVNLCYKQSLFYYSSVKCNFEYIIKKGRPSPPFFYDCNEISKIVCTYSNLETVLLTTVAVVATSVTTPTTSITTASTSFRTRSALALNMPSWIRDHDADLVELLAVVLAVLDELGALGGDAVGGAGDVEFLGDLGQRGDVHLLHRRQRDHLGG